MPDRLEAGNVKVPAIKVLTKSRLPLRMTRISDKLRVSLICISLALATFIAFEQLLNSDFVNFDDDKYITRNPQVKSGLTGESVIWAFTTPHGDVGFWHPLTSLSHILDYQLFGTNAAGHHMTSLLFHIANTLLLFLVLKIVISSRIVPRSNQIHEMWPCATQFFS